MFCFGSKIRYLFSFLLYILLTNINAADIHSNMEQSISKRVPAEWETHTATWMQWPRKWEAEMRLEFARIIDIIQDYEPVHIVAHSKTDKNQAQQFLVKHGVFDTQITWHIAPINNSWMRDNGAVYVTDGVTTWIQNWRFDAWGGNWGQGVGYKNDNRIPIFIAKYLDIKVKDYQHYVLEKGNAEFNGVDTMVLNWDCQNQRNPDMTQAEHETLLKQAFGVRHIIWAYGYDPEDGTTGHIDGTARFINQDTLVVTDYYDTATEYDLVIAAEKAGLQVIRYSGDPNWLVGNGFVIAAMDYTGHHSNHELKAQLALFFPERDIHLIDITSIAEAGGGIHCVTNDQPAF